MNELILVNKESGYTSRDVVNVISKLLKTKKVGHFGTLDPLATGLLLVGVNKYTALGKFLSYDTKEYVAKVLIGRSTDTYDIEGVTVSEKDVYLSKEKIIDALDSFKKTYMQEVPIYSAVKVNGKKLYEYAREGKEVILPKKEVTIYDIELLSFTDDYFIFRCLVSKGTYIRSLINDIGKYLDVPLCMYSLKRIAQDKFSLDDAYTLDDIKAGNYKSLNIRDVIDLEEREIPISLEKKILNGSIIDKISDRYIIFTKDKEDIVLYGPYENKMKPVLTLKDK